MSTDFDAIVVGAGAVGLACGYALARDGKTVAVVERDAASALACRRATPRSCTSACTTRRGR